MSASSSGDTRSSGDRAGLDQDSSLKTDDSRRGSVDASQLPLPETPPRDSNDNKATRPLPGDHSQRTKATHPLPGNHSHPIQTTCASLGNHANPTQTTCASLGNHANPTQATQSLPGNHPQHPLPRNHSHPAPATHPLPGNQSHPAQAMHPLPGNHSHPTQATHPLPGNHSHPAQAPRPLLGNHSHPNQAPHPLPGNHLQHPLLGNHSHPAQATRPLPGNQPFTLATQSLQGNYYPPPYTMYLLPSNSSLPFTTQCSLSNYSPLPLATPPLPGNYSSLPQTTYLLPGNNYIPPATHSRPSNNCQSLMKHPQNESQKKLDRQAHRSPSQPVGPPSVDRGLSSIQPKENSIKKEIVTPEKDTAGLTISGKSSILTQEQKKMMLGLAVKCDPLSEVFVQSHAEPSPMSTDGVSPCVKTEPACAIREESDPFHILPQSTDALEKDFIKSKPGKTSTTDKTVPAKQLYRNCAKEKVLDAFRHLAKYADFGGEPGEDYEISRNDMDTSGETKHGEGDGDKNTVEDLLLDSEGIANCDTTAGKAGQGAARRTGGLGTNLGQGGVNSTYSTTDSKASNIGNIGPKPTCNDDAPEKTVSNAFNIRSIGLKRACNDDASERTLSFNSDVGHAGLKPIFNDAVSVGFNFGKVGPKETCDGVFKFGANVGHVGLPPSRADAATERTDGGKTLNIESCGPFHKSDEASVERTQQTWASWRSTHDEPNRSEIQFPPVQPLGDEERGSFFHRSYRSRSRSHSRSSVSSNDSRTSSPPPIQRLRISPRTATGGAEKTSAGQSEGLAWRPLRQRNASGKHIIIIVVVIISIIIIIVIIIITIIIVIIIILIDSTKDKRVEII